MRISYWSSDVCSSDLLSGGLDSMVCAGLAREAGARIVALTIDYNQRHRVEIESAARIADFVGAAEHIVLPLDQLGRASCWAKVCQYCWISVVDVSLKKKNHQLSTILILLPTTR